MKILKFGGTSVGNADAIRSVAKIVSHEKSPLVICSAMSGITNLLLKMAGDAAEGNSIEADFKSLEKKHFDTIRELLPAVSQNEVFISVKLLLNQLEEIVTSISNIRELSERTKATIVGFGEQMSCLIIAAYFKNQGLPSFYVDARELIKTDSVYNNAAVNEKTTEKNIQKWYATVGEKIPVITGFISSDLQQRTTNLGRGGSDYTAAIFGAALLAEEIQIWTDVDGFFTADPRLVRNAFALKELSYEEAMELSYFGAKVIYPPTMIPAITKQIPVVIKNTFNPTHAGTFIRKEIAADSLPVKGISSISDISLVNIEGNGMVGFKGFSGRLFNALAGAGVNIILITQASSEHSISLGISPADKEAALQAIAAEFENEISIRKVEAPSCEDNLSIIAVVGKNMKNAIGISGMLFGSLGRSGVNISAIAQGSSELNISAVIKKTDLKKALNAAHDALFLSSYKTLHLFIAGTGNIGSELLRQIYSSSKWLKENRHLLLKVVGITNRRNMLFDGEEGITLDNWQQDLINKGETADFKRYMEQMFALNLPNSIFVDNTSGSSVSDHYEEIFRHHISVVTCNKSANSSSLEKYNSLKHLAKINKACFNYETNVGAGLPVINTLQNFILSGDEVIRIEAVLSGTFSYVLNNYSGEKTFSEVIRKAQELGYTEPDPRDDLNGEDFRRKTLILAREMGRALEKENIRVEQILPDSCIRANSIPEFYNELSRCESKFSELKMKAKKENKRIRYIATIDHQSAGIEMKLVDSSHPFYDLSGSDNIISFTTNRYQTNPLVVKGPGAGAAVTAAGVFSDIVKVAS